MKVGIDAYVDRCISINEEERSYFHSILRPETFSKNSHLLQAGEICDWEAFVVNGCVRIYYLDENGGEVNLMFAVEDWWVSDLASKVDNLSAELYIQALEDTEVLIIKAADKDAWFHLGTFEAGAQTAYRVKKEGNGIYAFIINGSATIDGQELGHRDGLGIEGAEEIAVTSHTDGTEVLLMEVPMQ